MTEKYKIDYETNKCSDAFTTIMTLANCVQSKKLSDVFSPELTGLNDDNICSIDIHNLPYLHYLTGYLVNHKTDANAYKTLVNCFCIHQGIGFTLFVDDITGRRMTLEQQLRKLKQIKKCLRILYKKCVSQNNVYSTLFVITLLDIVHHSLRIFSSSLYLISEPQESVCRVSHNIMHWISLFTNVYFEQFTNKSEENFQTYVRNPILLSSWLCAHGCCHNH
jgi:hypothetical protein